MVNKVKKSTHNPLKQESRVFKRTPAPRLIKMICSECGIEVKVLKGSRCYHCGCVMEEIK